MSGRRAATKNVSPEPRTEQTAGGAPTNVAFARRFLSAIEPAYPGGIGRATGAAFDHGSVQVLDGLERLDPQLPLFSRRHVPEYGPIRVVTVAPSLSRPYLWVAAQMGVAPRATHIVKDLMIFNLRDGRAFYAGGRPAWLEGASTTWIPIGAPWSWFGRAREFGYTPESKVPSDHHLTAAASSSDFPDPQVRASVEDALTLAFTRWEP